MMAVLGTPLLDCTSHHPIVGRFRVHLNNKIEALADGTATRVVDYDNSSDDTNAVDDEVVTTSNTWSDPADAGVLVPYSVDLTSTTLPKPTTGVDSWVAVKIVLRDRSKSKWDWYAAKPITFVLTDPASGVSLSTPADICSAPNGIYDNQHNGLVYKFYIKLKPSTGHPFHIGFNVVLQPRVGATSTPVTIDPKILNDG